ncbi:MFS general substrate transporter [Ascodesmis nigricans]|uniref:MFS general substrate transporter n=1 Tax=Ascodesmis nigricans TaxID=341454 RepID=A0A4S2ML88_9PEZI|nr:MFS general substrate transporter [Ascodesmis nigricans]
MTDKVFRVRSSSEVRPEGLTTSAESQNRPTPELSQQPHHPSLSSPDDKKHKGKKPPIGLWWRSGEKFITLTVAVAVFTDIFLYGLIVPVFPFSLPDRAGVRENEVQRWISVLLAVYGAGLLAASPVCGYISDHTSGRMLPFMLGLVALICSTVMLCVGNTIALLVVGRLIQGMSGAVVWIAGLALLVDTVGRGRVGEAMGIVSVALSLAMFLAPLLGGLVYHGGGYFAVFGMAFGLLGLDVLLRVVVIEKKTATKYESPVTPTVMENANEETEKPQAAPGPSLSLKSTTETKEVEPLPERPTTKWQRLKARLPPVITLLCHPRLDVALWGSCMQAILMTSFETTVPLFVNETFGWNSVGGGLVFLSLVIPTFLGPLVGKICDRYGPRFVATLGFIVGCPPTILLRFVSQNTMGHKVLLCALLFLVGVAMTLVITPFLAEITFVVIDLEDRKPGRFGKQGAIAQAYGLFNIAFAAGTMIGPLLAGFIRESKGWNIQVLVLGILWLASAVPTIIYTGGKLSSADIKWGKAKLGLN